MLDSTTGNEPAIYRYDNKGNVVMDSTTIKDTLGYDQLNRLISFSGGVQDTYYYDGEGKRIMRDYSGNKTVYLYDQWGNLISEVDTEGNFICDYIWANGKLVAKTYPKGGIEPQFGGGGAETEGGGPPPIPPDSDQIFYYHLDHLGTPLALTMQIRSRVWVADYLPFGELYSELVFSASNDVRFPGQYHDRETGLYYNWHRYYKPTLGRYYQADPIELGSANRFQYVLNNPLTYIDPSGLTWIDNIRLFFDWFYERGKGIRPYGPDTPQTREMSMTEGARIMRAQFKKGGCKTSTHLGTYGSFDAFLESLNNPFNATQVQVGRFEYGYLNNRNGTVTYVIINDLTMYSFYYHFGEPIVSRLTGIRYPRWFIKMTHHPRDTWFPFMGKLKQIFYWTEPLPEGCPCK